MYYYNSFDHKKELTVNEGERVEIIKRSSVYCVNNEEPIYHSGRINKIVFEEGSEPVGMHVKFDKDTVYNDGEEEFISFDEIEELFPKKYEIVGFAMLNEGVTLSITGENFAKTINFDYKNGDLIPVSIQEIDGSVNNSISEEDEKLIQEVMQYGTAQKYTHYVISRSK